MEKKQLVSKFVKAVKKNLTFNAFVFLIWLVLGWLRSYGITSLILFPFNFITGALIGVDGGSFFEGVLGKTLMLLLLNSLIRPLIFSTGNKKEKSKKAFAELKSKSLLKIPQYMNIKQLVKVDAVKRGFNLIGFGTTFLVYPIITGDGSLQNSGVCLLAAIALFKQLKSIRGFIVVFVNDALRKFGKNQINKDSVNRLVSGNALGFACTVVFALLGISVGYAPFIGFVILLFGAGSIMMKKNDKMIRRTASFLVVLILVSSNVILAFASLIYDANVNSNEDFEEISDSKRLIEVLLDGESSRHVLTGEGLNDDGTLTLDGDTEKSFSIVLRSDYDEYDPLYFSFSPMIGGSYNTVGYGEFEINGQPYYIDETIDEELAIQNMMLNKKNNLGTFLFQGAYIIKPVISQEIIDEAIATNNFDRFNALSEEWERLDVSAEGEVIDIFYNYFVNENQIYLGFDLVNEKGELSFFINGDEIAMPLIPSFDRYNQYTDEGIEMAVMVKILNGYFEKTGSLAGPIEVTTVALLSFALSTTVSGVISGVGSAPSGFSGMEDESINDPDEEIEETEETEEADEAEESEERYFLVINNDELMPPLCNGEKASVVIPVNVEEGEGLHWRYSVVPYPVRPDIFIPTIINHGQDSTAQLSIFLTGKRLNSNNITIILHVSAIAKENGKILGKAKKTVQATLYNLGLNVELKDASKGYVKDNMVLTEVINSKIKGIAEIKKLKDDEYEIDSVEGKVFFKNGKNCCVFKIE